MPATDYQLIAAAWRVLPQHDADFPVGRLFKRPDFVDGDEDAAVDAHELISEFLLKRFERVVDKALAVHVMDGDGNSELVYRLPEADRYMQCHEPRPLRPRRRELYEFPCDVQLFLTS